MNKKYLLIIITAILLVFSGIYFYSKIVTDTTTSNRTYPESSNFSFYAIHDFKQKDLAPGTYDTEGYVVKRYECPPCPKGALCKPCMRDNIVISEKNELLDTYSLSNTEIIIFASNPKQFELGKKYRFSVKILDYNTTGEPINDIELIGYNSIENNVSALVDFCKEGVRGNNCIRCSCDSVNDCKLVTNPYVISECSKPEAVSRKTSESCLDEVRKMAIQATCVVPENYVSPEYEIVCVNNTCGKIEK